jgi:hypothetical protein
LRRNQTLLELNRSIPKGKEKNGLAPTTTAVTWRLSHARFLARTVRASLLVSPLDQARTRARILDTQGCQE